MTDHAFNVAASKYLAALYDSNIEIIVTVPDWMQLALHQRLDAPDSGIKQVMCCNEDQVIAVTTGLHLAGKRAVAMIQNQGFYACINTIRAIGLDAGLPLVMMIGQFGREEANFGHPTTESSRNTVRLLEPVMNALGIRFWNIESEDDVASIGQAITHAYRNDCPVALNVGTPMAWS